MMALWTLLSGLYDWHLEDIQFSCESNSPEIKALHYWPLCEVSANSPAQWNVMLTVLSWDLIIIIMYFYPQSDQEWILPWGPQQHPELWWRAQHLRPGRAGFHLHHHEASLSGRWHATHQNQPLLNLHQTRPLQLAHCDCHEVSPRGNILMLWGFKFDVLTCYLLTWFGELFAASVVNYGISNIIVLEIP